MSVKIVYQDIAAGAAEEASVSSADAAGFSVLTNLPSGGCGAAIASLEPLSWTLDGSREILDAQPVAFWSAEMSGADGRFDSPPEIAVSFGNRYTSPGVSLTFAPGAGEFCSWITLEWYRGASLLYKTDFYPDSTEFFCAQTVTAYDKLILRFHMTNRPFRYAKVEKIMLGVARTFLRPELRSVKVTQEVSVISSQVAVNTLDFTLDSSGDIEYMFQMKQPVLAYDGENLSGVFYIEDSNRRAKGLYHVSCKDATGILDDDPFPAGMYQEYPAKQLFLDILGGKFSLEMDPALENYPISGYLPDGSRREALQQAAFAMGAIVDTSGTDKIRVYQDREDLPRKLPEHRVYAAGNSVTTSAIVTAVQVTAHSYSTAGSGSDTVEVNGTTYYHTAETTAITNPNVTASDKPNVIVVDKATLVNPENAAAAAQRLYNYCAMRQKQRVRIVLNGERPGDHVAVPTPWGSVVDGFLTSMRVVLSGVAAAECEITGTDVRAVGDSERFMCGEVLAGEV